MAKVVVSTFIDAPPSKVWNDVADIPSHVEWMQDAEAIRFTSDSTFECDTKVGPFRLTDRMTITDWAEGRAIGIRHEGIVTGAGRFTLTAEGAGTRFSWAESLRFPWWMGGPVGSAVAAPILRRIWRGNLERLRRRLEAPAPGPAR